MIESKMCRAALLVFILGAEAAAGGGDAASHDGSEGCLHGRLERAALRAGADSKAFDEATGRDKRNFPPDRVVDYQHMKLQIRFEDLNEQRCSAVETLTLTPIGKPANGLTLDAIGLKVNKAQIDGKDAEFSQDDAHVMLRFDPPLSDEAEHVLVLEYECNHPYDGLVFTPASPEAPHYTAEVHTQGQTDTNKHWFVCHDFPNERMSTELIVDVPAGHSVSSNGKLISNLTSGERALWHYLQEKPHVPYLVSLVIGKFDIVEIPHARVPMKVWVAQGLGDRVMQTYGRTGEMIDLLERRLGVAYPWDRYDQLCAKNFGAGGMENTSATTMYPTAILDKTALLDGDLDGLIAHELAHQWTGDLITCKSWAHIWLNEGWATYGSALWNEQRFGEDGYLESIRGNFGVAERDKTTGEIPMVSPIWEQPFETFRRPGNPYPKGSAIIHMLRRMLGEEVFWNGVHLYMNRHALGVVETNDFRYAMEEVSGLGLEWFFEQWCYRPGTPELNVQVEFDGTARELSVRVRQMQQIDERTPAFRFALPVVARVNGEDQTFTIEVREQDTTFRMTLAGVPTIVAIDPYLHVLKTMTVEKPLGMWTEQVNDGPTIVAKHEALEALAKHDSPPTIALLEEIIRDDKTRYTLRNTAVNSLAAFGSKEAKDALLAILNDGVSEAKVRVTLIEKLKNYDKDEAVPRLVEIARNDESYATRVAAIGGLAHHKATDHADLIVQLVEFESQHDQVRNAALRALGELDDARGLDVAMKYAAYGYVDRSRPVAVEVIGKLAEHDEERALDFLLPLLNDPEQRTVNTAGAALAEIGAERAEQPIRALAESHRDPSMRERAAEWLKQMQKE